MTPEHRVGEIRPGDDVRVHVNLHKGNLSVVNRRTGRVIANVDDITLAGVKFRVQPAGLQRIRRGRQRAVCAYATGTVVAVDTRPDVTGYDRVSFNPLKADTFMCNGEPIFDAPTVVFRDRSGWVERAGTLDLPAKRPGRATPSPGRDWRAPASSRQTSRSRQPAPMRAAV